MYKVTLWDTFDNETITIKEDFKTVEQAEEYIFKHFNITVKGADKIEIRNQTTNMIAGSHSTSGRKI